MVEEFARFASVINEPKVFEMGMIGILRGPEKAAAGLNWICPNYRGIRHPGGDDWFPGLAEGGGELEHLFGAGFAAEGHVEVGPGSGRLNYEGFGSSQV